MQVQTDCTTPWFQHSHIWWKNFIGHLNCILVKRMILTRITDTNETSYTPDSTNTKWLRESPKASCECYATYAAETMSLTLNAWAMSGLAAMAQCLLFVFSLFFCITIRSNINTIFCLLFRPNIIWTEYSVQPYDAENNAKTLDMTIVTLLAVTNLKSV